MADRAYLVVRAVVADAVQRRSCAIPDLFTELDAGPNAGSVLFREALTDVAEGTIPAGDSGNGAAA